MNYMLQERNCKTFTTTYEDYISSPVNQMSCHVYSLLLPLYFLCKWKKQMWVASAKFNCHQYWKGFRSITVPDKPYTLHYLCKVYSHSYSVFYHNNKHSHLYSSPVSLQESPQALYIHSILGSKHSHLHAFMKLVLKSECNALLFACRHLNLTLFVCANKKMTSQSHTSNSSEKPVLACKSATCLGKCFIGIAPTSSQGWEKTKNIFMQNQKPVTYNEVYMQAIHKTSWNKILGMNFGYTAPPKIQHSLMP